MRPPVSDTLQHYEGFNEYAQICFSFRKGDKLPHGAGKQRRIGHTDIAPMVSSAIAGLSLCLSIASSSTLRLAGENSFIEFGTSGTSWPESGTARLHASCGNRPNVLYLAPTEVSVESPRSGNEEVVLHLGGVGSCASVVSIRTPCVASFDYPPLFYCIWHGRASNVAIGPRRARREADQQDGTIIGFRSVLSCPVPSHDELLMVHGGGFDGSEPYYFNVSVVHFAPSGSESLALPFDGMPAGNAVRVANLITPPPPASPPAAPPPCDFDGSTSSKGLASGCNDLFRRFYDPGSHCSGTLESGVRWVTVDGAAQQVFCYFDGTLASGAGWTLVAKIAGSSSKWTYNAPVYTDASTFGDLVSNAPHASRDDAKSALYHTLRGTAFRLAEMDDAALDGPSFEFSGTAQDLFRAGSARFDLAEGSWSGIPARSHWFQGDPNYINLAGANHVLVKTSGAFNQERSCCGVDAAVMLGLTGGAVSSENGGSNSAFVGIGGKYQFRDAHFWACCNYASQSVTSAASSSPSGFALLLKD